MSIQILPEHIANQIAAGEVVEGPSSIIKELVENSIDAAATKIDIELSKQLLKIVVVDNGTGMSPEDLVLAFKRHATSKITAIEDLYNLDTNGFRGEALASISAVSRLTCVTKRDEDSHASKVYIENDKQELSQAGAATGTKIVIDDLFFNTPARLKFLKSNNKERNFIVDLVRGLALANPAIAFSLVIDDRSVVKTSGSSDLKATIGEIFSESICGALVKLDMERSGINVTGYTTQAHVTRSDKRGIFTIVNGRLVSCYILRSALEAVYRDILPPGKSPIAVIQLELDKADVDVNVHPNKKELKYKDTNKVYTLVGDATAKALADNHYQSKESFQPSFRDYQVSQTNIIEPKQQEPASQAIIAKPNYQEHFSYESRTVERLESTNRKFVSRFGSVDISIVDAKGLETVIESLGNKTSFEIVSKNDKQAAIVKGDFIGDNWLKDKYLGFLHDLAADILARNNLETNFKKPISKPNSRPAAKPKLSQLEEIWQRDNYSCVYCAKPLLHPEIVKESLVKCHDPKELNKHLASFDHHNPASKFPELNQDSRNLFACCQECNIKKSDSLATKTWSPSQYNSWEAAPVAIAGIEFEAAN